ETDTFGLFAGQRLAQQQVVLGLGHATEQRPYDRCMVTGCYPEARVAIDDACSAARHGDVGEHGRGEAGAGARALDRRHHGLRAIDEVVEEVVRFLPDARACCPIARHLLDHVEIAAGREAPPSPRNRTTETSGSRSMSRQTSAISRWPSASRA